MLLGKTEDKTEKNRSKCKGNRENTIMESAEMHRLGYFVEHMDDPSWNIREK